MAKKKLKLKKSIKLSIALIIILIIGVFTFIKVRENYLYKQTYEYKFLQIGYTLEEIDLLLNTLEEERLLYLLQEEKDTTLLNIISQKYYKNDNLQRYLDYLTENNSSSIEDVILMVNLNRDYDFYEVSYEADIFNNYEMLVNKYFLLPSSYEPDDLTKIKKAYSWGDNYARKEVVNAFLEMWNEANKEDIYLMVSSSYRSYKDQNEVYNSYADLKGESYADTIAARPGASEHQTGLALDIFEIKNSSIKTFHESKAYTWLKDNSYKFGFILRYPENYENITGYDYESWHYRYVGKNLANYLYTNNLTLDEYYALEK